MGKYGLALILAIAYTAGSAVVVQSQGEAHRKALLAESQKPDAPLPSPAPILVASPAEIAPTPAPAPEAKAPAANVEVARNANPPKPDPAPIPKAAATEKEKAKASREAFWTTPEMSKVWDLKQPTLDDESALGATLYKAILEMKPESGENALLSRVEDAAEPLLKLRVRKERPVKFVVLEGSEWNAFSHPGDYIYITSGLMKHFSANEDEAYLIQFVIAHELFHLDNLHALIALNLPGVVSRPGGTAEHFFLMILPFAYPDEPEFFADRWAYQTLLKPLGHTPLEAREFLMHFENYAKRNNFESGRAKPIVGPGRVLFDNHFPAHPSARKRLRLLKELAEPGAAPKADSKSK